MSGKENSTNYQTGSRKKRRNKRQATSPLYDNSGQLNTSTSADKDKCVNTGEQGKEPLKRCKQDNSVSFSQPVGDFLSCFNFQDYQIQNMAFQTQNMPQNIPFNMSQQPFMQSPPPGQLGFHASPPPWATKLLEDVEHIKQKLESVEKVEKTVNVINSKVSDLETKLRSLDTRVTETEKCCEFLSETNESHKSELKTAKKQLDTLQKTCQRFEKETQELKTQNDALDTKLTDLEARSMRENLMFYGIPEGGNNENCEELVKRVCTDIMQMQRTHEMTFDRAHRAGSRSGSKVRPIVVKFHYYSEREEVRKKSFDYTEQLKASNIGIGAQLPKEIRDARKPLYPAMKKAKSEGKSVKFVGKK